MSLAQRLFMERFRAHHATFLNGVASMDSIRSDWEAAHKASHLKALTTHAWRGSTRFGWVADSAFEAHACPMLPLSDACMHAGDNARFGHKGRDGCRAETHAVQHVYAVVV